MRFRACESSLAAGIPNIVRLSDITGRLVSELRLSRIGFSRQYRKKRGVPYNPQGTLSGALLVRPTSDTIVTQVILILYVTGVSGEWPAGSVLRLFAAHLERYSMFKLHRCMHCIEQKMSDFYSTTTARHKSVLHVIRFTAILAG